MGAHSAYWRLPGMELETMVYFPHTLACSMPTFDVGPTTIPAFEIDDTYWFTYFFEEQELFGKLRQYYNGEQYRFEVPVDDLEDVKEILDQFYYELDPVGDLEAYCVVKEQYTKHAPIMKQSVDHWTREGHHFFLMKDRQAVDFVVEQGATPISETKFVLGI